MENSNAPPEMLKFYGSKVTADKCVVLNDAQEALSVFLGCRPDYETISSMMGVERIYRGVNRCELRDVIEMSGIRKKSWPRLLSQVRMIESGALKGFREQQEKAA